MSAMLPQQPNAAATSTGSSFVGDQEKVLSLKDILATLWRSRLLIGSVTILFTLLAGGASLLLEKEYDASVVVSAVSDDSGGGRLGGLGAFASQVGGLASLAGLSLSNSDRKAESLAILESHALTELFIKNNNLLPLLYADKWDATNQKWKENTGTKVPTLWQGAQYFKKGVRRVTTNSKTGLSTLAVTWNDPQLAAKWANALVALTNEMIRARTIAEGERNIDYLNEQLRKSNLVAVQNSIATLLESETKKVMLARGTDEYAFRVLDPAIPPENPSFPNPLIWTFLGLVVGLIASSAFALTRGSTSEHLDDGTQ